MAFPPQEFYEIERTHLCEAGAMILTVFSAVMDTNAGLGAWNAFTVHTMTCDQCDQTRQTAQSHVDG
jgi:hypothetical protein